MANEFDETVRSNPEDLEPLEDLDIDIDEASNVKGGRFRLEDPCAGGE